MRNARAKKRAKDKQMKKVGQEISKVNERYVISIGLGNDEKMKLHLVWKTEHETS